MEKMNYLCAVFSKMERFVVYVCISICMFQIPACNDVVSPPQDSTISNRPIRRSMAHFEFPSTSPAALMDKIQEYPDIICPAKAYTVATYELENGKYRMLQRLRDETVYDDNQLGEYSIQPNEPHAWHLTESPRMILDFDGKIKYYEFGLVEDDEITSIITVYARREAPCAIAYMFPYVLPYDNADHDYYEAVYPCRVFHDGVGYRAVENCEQNAYLNYSEQEYWNALYEQLPPEEIDEMEALRLQASVPDVEYDDEAMAYWNTIDDLWIALGYDIPCVDDGHNGGGTPITIAGNTYVQSLKDYLGTSEQCFDYTARPYRSTLLQKTYWDCACGPAALAWIYRGLYDEYPPLNGEYLLIHGDAQQQFFIPCIEDISYYDFNLNYLSNWPAGEYLDVRQEYINRSMQADNGLTENFFNHCHFFKKTNGNWGGFMLPVRLGTTFYEATNHAYTVGFDCSALTASEHIYNNDLPVVLLVYTDIFWDHYLIAYGYGGITTSGHNVERKNLYFLIMDNGYTISKHHYKPYWRAYKSCEYYHQVMRNS